MRWDSLGFLGIFGDSFQDSLRIFTNKLVKCVGILWDSWGFLEILWRFSRIFDAFYNWIYEILGFFGILGDSLKILWGFLRINWGNSLGFFGILWDSWGFWWIFEDFYNWIDETLGFLEILWGFSRIFEILMTFVGILWDSLEF